MAALTRCHRSLQHRSLFNIGVSYRTYKLTTYSVEVTEVIHNECYPHLAQSMCDKKLRRWVERHTFCVKRVRYSAWAKRTHEDFRLCVIGCAWRWVIHIVKKLDARMFPIRDVVEFNGSEHCLNGFLNTAKLKLWVENLNICDHFTPVFRLK